MRSPMPSYRNRFLGAALSGGIVALVIAAIAGATLATLFPAQLPLATSRWALGLLAAGSVLVVGSVMSIALAAAAAVWPRRDGAAAIVAVLVSLALVARGTIGLLPLWGGALAGLIVAALAAATVSPFTAWTERKPIGSAAASFGLVAFGLLLMWSAAPEPFALTGSAVVPSSAAAGELGSGASAWPPDRPRPRNVVLIVIDTLRADHLGCYGYERATSPQIDRLAAQSARFTDASVQYPMTSPSMATILTGLTPARHNLVSCRTVLPRAVTTLAEQLAANGVVTAAVVSNPNLARAFQFDQGFQDYDEAFRRGAKQPGSEITARALSWLQRRGPEPFFLYVHYLDPHSPYDPPAPFRDTFLHDAFSAKHTDLELSLRRGTRGEITPDAVIEGGATDADRYVARYDEEILAVDHEVGRLMAALQDHGLADQSAVILTADHGESLVERAVYFNHGDFSYQNNARVPLLVRGPGITAGGALDQQVEGSDIAPTILDLLGVPPLAAIDGRSLVPLLVGDPGAWPDEAVTIEAGHVAGRPSGAWRAGRWKLIHNHSGLDEADLGAWRFLTSARRWQRLWLGATGRQPYQLRWELYDLLTDPNETRNLVIEQPERFRELAPALLSWQRSLPRQREFEQDPDSLDPEVRKQLESLGYVH